MRNLVLSGLTILMMLNFAACADHPSHPSHASESIHWWEHAPFFLAPDAVPVRTVLPSPPAPHSPVDDQDHAELLRLQSTRSVADCQRAGLEVGISLDSFYGPGHGPLTQSELAKWTTFMEEVTTDTDYFVRNVKKQWKRPRPFRAFSDIHPCVPLESSSAYPSGHTTISRTMADVLSFIYPDRKAQFMARADQVASDRVLGGVHHPSDIEAGKKLGDAIYAALASNARFIAELRKQQDESENR